MLSNMFNASLVRMSVRYGLIGSLLCLGFIVVLYYMDRHPFLINPFVDPRIPAFGILLFFGLKELRDFNQGGNLYFWQGMIGGFLFTLVCASVCSLGIFAFASMEPEFVSRFVSLGLEQTKAFSDEDINRIGRETFDRTIRELEAADAGFMATRYFFQSFIISFFVSIIVSVILRRTVEPPMPNA
ncbi:MAG: DUF4199 domain-containing protein [Cyclobacteriaceae bacterium]|nr:DUF4199 domain-containing protein [Cyclobacteriaceae bacterium]